MVTMAQGLNLKIIHSAIDFMVGFFLTVHSQERTRNLQKKNTWFTMVYPHSPRKKNIMCSITMMISWVFLICG
jgi:hypothetical protein